MYQSFYQRRKPSPNRTEQNIAKCSRRGRDIGWALVGLDVMNMRLLLEQFRAWETRKRVKHG